MAKKTAVIFSFLFLLLTIPLPANAEVDYQVLPNRTKLPYLTPGLKNQETLRIRLQNGLEAYLISDPDSEQSGAMLSVNTGSWEDPIEYPGLAHFVEHMLFLGTLKYPKESEYQKFIADHGGTTNAFTDSRSTNYVFTVSHKNFNEALDRFASFFKEPMFNLSGLSRELHAINQEYSKNIEQDPIRQLYVLKEIANPAHPFSRFAMGNQLSLSGASREMIEQWFQEHYSANLMKLVVYSPLPLNRLAMLVQKDFSGIPNKQKEPYTPPIPAFKAENEKRFTYIEPVKDSRSLTLVWELPEKFAYMLSSKPEQIVGYVFGYEGGKSLLAQLKREHLAESLSAGGTKLGNNLMLFFIDIELTADGLRDIDQVITRCFQTISALQKTEIPERLFHEIQTMAAIQYQYQSKNDLFEMLMQHAEQIQNEDLSTYPEHSAVVQTLQPAEIQEFVRQLTPQNAQYLITAPSKLTGISATQRERWLGVEYTQKAIPKENLDRWRHAAPHNEIDLPAPNMFIPDNLQLVHSEFTPSSRLIPEPSPLSNDAKSRFYFAPDNIFGVPKVYWSFDLLTPAISMSAPESIAFADIYIKSLQNRLDDISYPAKMAGLSYSLSVEKNGINIMIDGYSQNAPRLLKEILKTIESYQPDPLEFQILKDSFLRKYTNFAKEQPITQSMEIFQSIAYGSYATEKEKAIALRNFSFKKYEECLQELFQKTYLIGTLYGNITEASSRSILNEMRQAFNGPAYAKEDQLRNEVIVLPQDQGPYFLETYTESQGNAVILAVEGDGFSHKKRAAQQILMQALKAPFFATLRTQQQTGYIVSSSAEEMERKLFNLFAVQSSTHDVRDLLARFEQFIESYVKEIGKTELLEPQFKNIQDALTIKYSEPAENMSKMGELLHTLAFDYDGDFKWMQKRLDALKELSYSEFVSISKELLGRQNRRRLAILMRGEIAQEGNLAYTKARTWNMIRKMSAYEPRTEAAAAGRLATE